MLTRPCKDCPFRVDVKPYLREERVLEIWDSLEQGAAFPCHKTTTHTDDGEYVPNAKAEQFCAGALSLMEAYWGHGAAENQMVRIQERLGLLDLGKLDTSVECFEDPYDMADYHGSGS